MSLLPAISAIGAVTGLIGSLNSNKSASRAQGQALDLERERVEMAKDDKAKAEEWRKKIQALIDQGVTEGLFDPVKQAAASQNVLDRRLAADREKRTVISRLMGYKPGDTALPAGDAAIKLRWMRDTSDNIENAKQRALLTRLQVEGMARPDSNASAGVSSATGAQADSLMRISERDRASGSAGIMNALQTVMPYLDKMASGTSRAPGTNIPMLTGIVDWTPTPVTPSAVGAPSFTGLTDYRGNPHYNMPSMLGSIGRTALAWRPM